MGGAEAPRSQERGAFLFFSGRRARDAPRRPRAGAGGELAAGPRPPRTRGAWSTSAGRRRVANLADEADPAADGAPCRPPRGVREARWPTAAARQDAGAVGGVATIPAGRGARGAGRPDTGAPPQPRRDGAARWGGRGRGAPALRDGGPPAGGGSSDGDPADGGGGSRGGAPPRARRWTGRRALVTMRPGTGMAWRCRAAPRGGASAFPGVEGRWRAGVAGCGVGAALRAAGGARGPRTTEGGDSTSAASLGEVGHDRRCDR